jgi:glycosyl transferase, family 25
MAFVINLDHSNDRLAAFTAANRHLAVERFAALDGNTLDLGALSKRGLIAPGAESAFSRGALGCALSHRALWEIAAKRDAPTTIFEDDAVAHGQFQQLSERVIATLPPDWAMAMWGWNFDSVVMFALLPGVSQCRALFDQDGLRRNINAYQTLPLAPVAYRLDGCFGTPGYTVSPSGAKMLIETVFPIRRGTVFCSELDRSLPIIDLACSLHEVFARGHCHVSIPPLVVTRNDHQASTIGDPWKS